MPWKWDGLSANPNITMKIVVDNSRRPWNFHGLSSNPSITMDDIAKYARDYPWEWGAVVCNPNITMDFILKYRGKIDFGQLAGNELYWNKVVYKREIARDIAERRGRIRHELHGGDVLVNVIMRYIDYA